MISPWPEHASPLPWKYVASGSPSHRVMADWIEDATGGIVVENVGHIDGPAIVAAVNSRSELLTLRAERDAEFDRAEKFAAQVIQQQSRALAAEAQLARLREFAESFHITVNDNQYRDVALHLERPHALSLRLNNSSDKSWLFQDLEDRRKAAIARSTLSPEDSHG